MAKTYKFDPDYVVPTSEILREWLDENHLTTRVAVAGHVIRELHEEAAAQLDAVLNDGPVGPSEASLLAMVMGTSVQFWLNFEQNYRNGLARGLTVLGRDTST